MTEGRQVLSTRRAALALGGAGAGIACAAAWRSAAARQAAAGRWHEGDIVARHTFWDMLEGPARETLTEVGRRQTLRDGQTYMRQGEHGDRVCVIMEGRMKICMVSDHGEETVLDLHGPGDVVGEMEAMGDEPRVANAVAKGMTTVLSFSGERLRKTIEEYPSVGYALVRVLSDRLRNASEIRSARGTRYRITALVYQIANRYGRATPTKGEIAINAPLNREEFANWAGASRGSVGRALHWLQAREVIRLQGREIIVNWRRLRQALRDLGHHDERE